MQKALALLLISCLYSCAYFDAKKIASEDILNEELKSFNWNEVDVYPSFSSCDTLSSKSEKKHCFEQTISTFISAALQEETIVVTQDINDTILLEIQILETGSLHLKSLTADSLTTREIPQIERVLSRSLEALPEIFPALKRDQPVKTEFILPIVIEVY